MTGRIEGDAKERLRALVLAQGFARAGFTSADPVEDHVSAWIADGRHASLGYMARDAAGRTDPRRLLPGARTVICAAASYPPSDGRGAVAAYARGEDYHRTLRAALQRVADALARVHPRAAFRVCVDTSPLLERAFAARAGIGWIGRSSLLLDEVHGPWLLLGEILTDLDVAPDGPSADRCGTCTACVDACPTDALDGRKGLDARRCLSYWTIEHRGPLPDVWADALGQRAFGCDDCLVACPFGPEAEDEHARASGERSLDVPPVTVVEAPLDAHEEHAVAAAAPFVPRPAMAAEPPFVPRPELGGMSLDALEARARESFRKHFGRTPLAHARKGGLLRNLAAIRRRTEGTHARGTGPPPDV